MRMGRGTVIISPADHRQKGMCSQLREEEDELEASDTRRVVQV